jgi:sRNA-binding carbon storage regulator CsrA
MLILRIKTGQVGDVRIVVLKSGRTITKIGIEAPRTTPIARSDLNTKRIVDSGNGQTDSMMGPIGNSKLGSFARRKADCRIDPGRNRRDWCRTLRRNRRNPDAEITARLNPGLSL